MSDNELPKGTFPSGPRQAIDKPKTNARIQFQRSMSAINTFCAVHSSGLLIPNRSAVTALCLLFDKVYLPANVEAIRAFSQSYKIKGFSKEPSSISILSESDPHADPFVGLTEKQRATAMRYLDWCCRFAFKHASLFGNVFLTNAFASSSPMSVELVRQGAPGELNTYKVFPSPLTLTEGDEELYPTLLSDGYVPIVTHVSGLAAPYGKLNKATTKQLAALLAMKSVEMLFPSTRPAHPEIILEAREKLKGHLPQFWSSMFKLSTDLRKIFKESSNQSTTLIEAENLVDATIRPALLDLQHKLEAERKQWFFQVLSPIRNGLRLMIGNPLLTQQQLITNALVLAADASSGGSDHLRTIEGLKESSGLTYLLELDKLTNQHD